MAPGIVGLLATGIAMRKWKTACGLSLLLLCSVIWLRSLPEHAADDVRAVKVAGIQLEAVMFDDFLKATFCSSKQDRVHEITYFVSSRQVNKRPNQWHARLSIPPRVNADLISL